MIRASRTLRSLVPFVACAAACASTPPSAWLEVELLGGATAAPPSRVSFEPRMQIVLDLTDSLDRSAGLEDPTPLVAARTAAVQLLRSLPPRTEVGLQVMGIASGAACPPPVWFSPPTRETTPQQLAAGLGALRSRSEGSVSEALAGVRREIEQAGPPASWRVVLVTDLGAQCGGDPCRAVRELVDLGTQVDIVLVGADPPACLAEIEASEAPALVESLAPRPAPAFRVEAAAEEGVDEEAAEPQVWASGRAGQGPVSVPPGRAVVVVEVEPPFRIGPVDLRTGFVTTLRGVDFPGASPSWRAWSVGRRPAASEESTP